MNYTQLVDHVVTNGDLVPSRYGDTREALNLALTIDPHEPPTRPGQSMALGYMELSQLLAGTFDRAAIERVAPNANHNLFSLPMAYGPRIADQVETIIWTLQNDPLTRRAVLLISKPEDGPTANLPCTISVQFLRRTQGLLTLVSMRSWDLIKGLPYDLVVFGGLAQAMALAVGVPAGPLTVTAGSAHVYLTDLLKRPDGSTPDLEFYLTFNHFALAPGGETVVPWKYIREAAQVAVDPATWTHKVPDYIKAY